MLRRFNGVAAMPGSDRAMKVFGKRRVARLGYLDVEVHSVVNA